MILVNLGGVAAPLVGARGTVPRLEELSSSASAPGNLTKKTPSA
jgi:hypothetical protein